MSDRSPVTSDLLTFAELFTRWQGGEVDALDGLLSHVAWRYRLAVDDVFGVVFAMQASVGDDRSTVATWLKRIRGWLRAPASRSELLRLRGLKRADVRGTAGTDQTAMQHHLEQHAAAQDTWDAWREAEGHAPGDVPRSAMQLRAIVFQLVAGETPSRDVRAFLMWALGTADEGIGLTLRLPEAEVAAAIARGRSELLAAAGSNVAVALRRLLGYEFEEIAEELGISEANVRMRTTRGTRQLAAMVRELAA